MFSDFSANKSRFLCFCSGAYQAKASSHLQPTRKNIKVPKVLEHKYIFLLYQRHIYVDYKVKKISLVQVLSVQYFDDFPYWLLASTGLLAAVSG